MSEVKLFRTFSCPFALRIAWALTLKGVEYETVYEDIANKSVQLLTYNPIHKKVPVMVHNGIPICESLVILEYIDETWKDTTPFLSQSPLDRATTRFWAKFTDEQILPTYFACYTKQGKEQKEAVEKTMGYLKLVENLLNQNNYFSGEGFGYLDVVFAWLAFYSSPLEDVNSLPLLNAVSFPNLCMWKEKVCEILETTKTWPDQKAMKLKFLELKQSQDM